MISTTSIIAAVAQYLATEKHKATSYLSSQQITINIINNETISCASYIRSIKVAYVPLVYYTPHIH